MWIYTGDRQSSRLRIRYLKSLLSQEVGFFDVRISTGQVIADIASDTTLIQDAIGSKTGSLIHHLAQFLVGMVIAFKTLWQLSLLNIAVLPVMLLSGGSAAYMIISASSRNEVAYARAGELAHETMTQIRTVHAFVGEQKSFHSYSNALRSSVKLGIQANLAKGLGIGSQYGLGFATFACLLWFAGKFVRDGDTTSGPAFTTILIVVSSLSGLGQAVPDIVTISKAKVAATTIMETIKRKPLISPNIDGVVLEKVHGNIELRNVQFSYPSRPDIAIFQSLSFTIPAGKVVAVVGKSGEGKSTIISLIERFYDPTSGEILLDGLNIKCMQLKWLRDQMGLVSQEPALFAVSIRENILYGKTENASMDDVMKAASASCASTFIDMLPDGYETQVGERGMQLSGGQKQRIAIARAILKNPSILLLDEATSALDSDSEKSVQEALDRVMVGRTTVVVAHRLSTIQNADMIAVIEEGKISEIGSHQELMEKDGAYAALVKIQKDGVFENRVFRGHGDGSITNGSISQRTLSSLSNTDSVFGLALKTKEMGQQNDSRSKLSLKRLIKLNAREWPYALLAAITAVAAGSAMPLFSLTITEALEYLYSFDKDYMKKGLTKCCLYCCGLGLLSILAHTGEFYFSGIAGERITMRVRKAMFSAILRNEISWFDENNTSLIACSLSADAPSVKAATVDRIVAILQFIGLVGTAIIITFSLQWKIALISLVSFPAVVLSFVGQIQFMKGFSADLHMAYMSANTVAGDAISNIRTVAAFSAENKISELFSRQLSGSKKKAFVRGQVGGVGFGISQSTMYYWSALVMWYGSFLIHNGEASFGDTIKSFLILLVTSFAVADALVVAPFFLQNTKTLATVFQILDRKTEIDARDPKTDEVSSIHGSIELRQVSFSYPSRPDIQILKNINLHIRRGHRTALVGASGSGKSSVLSLIIRFYDPQSGTVLIDGKDIKQLRLESLRRHIGWVQQEPLLFNTSIYENINYGKEGATEAEVVEAAKAANVHGFVSGLPAGYLTEVGEKGVQLSGGQKQRIAIARAILKRPTILLLDEATSALDSESEQLVQAALDILIRNCTSVLVAHRLSTVKNSHCIAVLENGCIKEQGCHHELIAKKGSYFKLANLSTSEQDELVQRSQPV
ncbi:hypothetical protein KP509_35G032800 [Ceratopteris richardii]|nr:hypothetical protein KP509_35G032800 [Ceratopteris richardii]